MHDSIVTQEISRLLATHITHILATPIKAREKFSQQGWDYVCVCYVAAWRGNCRPCPPLGTALVLVIPVHLFTKE